MRKLFWITLLGAALTNLGCVVPSLHPLFTEDDLVFDPQLIGAWTDEDGDFWVFDKSNSGGYLLTVADTRELSEFDAHLLQLGHHRFLDLFPRIGYLEESLHEDHLLPVHTFHKVEYVGDMMLLIPMSLDWLEDQTNAGAVQVAHTEMPDGKLVLTAPTAELQDFVMLYADDQAAFPSEKGDSLVVVLEPSAL